ncbi:hypothetical protein [Paraflavitalea sp. CAU 1676]|uniref:hypothetical protein n=1 Tax=Paraflavitalea sp. CAU 1676 TaxID=3032598 RepID=UPI0023D99894|nr:hypothetical protein [Paraflavitalea sp. CAU 1676]MDF2188505.1 hypothetical protein [Paraflavitalea sp. CAU 1676]
MHKLTWSLIVFLIYHTAAAQTPEKYIAELLKPGVYLAGFLSFDQPAKPPRQVELERKVQAATLRNLKWFTDSISQVKDISAHHDKFGLTKDEATEYFAMEQPKPVAKAATTKRDTLEVYPKMTD